MFFSASSFVALLFAASVSATLGHRRHQSNHLSHAHKHRSAEVVNTISEGQVVVVNRCPYDVWIWSAGVPEGNAGTMTHVPSKSRYWEPFRTCDGSGDCGGVSIKVSKTSELVGGKETQFEYTISTYPGTSDQLVYYDISLVDCANGDNADNCPGHDLGLEIQSNLDGFQNLTCAAGGYCGTTAYYVPNPSPQPVRDHSLTSMDLYFRLCWTEPFFSKKSVAGRFAMEDRVEVETLAPRVQGSLNAITG